MNYRCRAGQWWDLGQWRRDRRLVRRYQQDGCGGETVTIATESVVDLLKLASAVIAAGEPVAWEDSAKQVNAPATGVIQSAPRSKLRATAR